MRTLPICLALSLGLACSALSSAAPVAKPAVAVPSPHFRIVNAKTGWIVELAPDGSVTSNHFPPAKLGADGRLVVSGVDGTFRIAPNGDVLDDKETFGRFVDDSTLWLDPNLTLTVTDDGEVTGVGKQSRDRSIRVEADDARSRKLALFVYASEARASIPFRAPSAGKSKPSVAGVVVAAVALGAIAALEMYGDAMAYKHRQHDKPAK